LTLHIPLSVIKRQSKTKKIVLQLLLKSCSGDNEGDNRQVFWEVWGSERMGPSEDYIDCVGRIKKNWEAI
jgi:hypothetical protein